MYLNLWIQTNNLGELTCHGGETVHDQVSVQFIPTTHFVVVVSPQTRTLGRSSVNLKWFRDSSSSHPCLNCGLKLKCSPA